MPIAVRQRTPSSETVTPAAAFEDYINRLVEDKLERVLREKALLGQVRKITDAVAKEEITYFILGKGKSDIKQLSVFDISLSLRLPVIQVEKIMDSFSKRGLVKEIYG